MLLHLVGFLLTLNIYLKTPYYDEISFYIEMSITHTKHINYRSIKETSKTQYRYHRLGCRNMYNLAACRYREYIMYVVIITY